LSSFTQVSRTICTSVPLWPSIRVSSDFSLLRQSSPSFGSQRLRSYSDPSSMIPDRSVLRAAFAAAVTPQRPTTPSPSLRIGVCHPTTRVVGRLLGPCYKTGQWKPIRQHPEHAVPPQGPLGACFALQGFPRSRAWYPPGAITAGATRGRGPPTFPRVFSHARNRCWPPPGPSAAQATPLTRLRPLRCLPPP